MSFCQSQVQRGTFNRPVTAVKKNHHFQGVRSNKKMIRHISPRIQSEMRQTVQMKKVVPRTTQIWSFPTALSFLLPSLLWLFKDVGFILFHRLWKPWSISLQSPLETAGTVLGCLTSVIFRYSKCGIYRAWIEPRMFHFLPSGLIKCDLIIRCTSGQWQYSGSPQYYLTVCVNNLIWRWANLCGLGGEQTA